ncbi:MAG: hypothetical protein CSA11_10725 [Chloroflexi bacterium]|nr:MAG: hypothetical protein CSA11_10725 [Chloroflexota bacterium]
MNFHSLTLTAVQAQAVTAEKTSFWLGAAGTGKTTALQKRLLYLLENGEPAYTLLVLVAELSHQTDYLAAIHQSGLGPYADLKITTYNRLAQDMVTLFWPLVARSAGFAHPFQPPTVLSYDLAQLLMWYTVTAMLAEGAFSDLRLRPQQIVSQLLDTLNRAALNGLSLDEAIQRQIITWTGEPERVRHLHDAETAVLTFRKTCLENSLLDLSLVIEVFDTQLVKHPEFHRYFEERFRHLLIDHVEEQTPAGQNFIANLMRFTQTTAIIYDAGGGYKRFMAADPLGANKFRMQCDFAFDFDKNFVTRPELTAVSNLVENYLMHTTEPTLGAEKGILKLINGRYRREMVAQLVSTLHELVHKQGVATNQIAIIAPYLDGAMRYLLAQALKQAELPHFFLRRRSSPREEPRVRAWLTWLALAHPEWQMAPSCYDVAEAFALSIHGLDPARAQLIVEQLYVPEEIRLLPISELTELHRERIGEESVKLVAELRAWLDQENGRSPLDTFLYNLFNGLLSQPRFQLKPDLAGAAVCDWLVQSAARLRQAAPAMGLHTPAEIGTAFIAGINQGLVTANPPDLGDPPAPDGIQISTMYGYLLTGKSVQIQVWLEAADHGWWAIPKQPLSNAFVLAQSRLSDEPWTGEDDFTMRNQLLSRIIRGLTNRCTDSIILANSDLDRRGLRQDGPLWRALQPARANFAGS